MRDINYVKTKLQSNKSYIQHTFNIEGMGVFGSFVRNEQKPGSDIDILVVFKKGFKDFFNDVRCKYYLEEILGAKVDLVMKDAIKPRLKDKIMREINYV